jgi:hypothetical protein
MFGSMSFVCLIPRDEKTRSVKLIKYQMHFTDIVNPKSLAKIIVRKRKLVNEVININFINI